MKINDGILKGKFLLPAVALLLAGQVYAGEVAVLDEIQGTVMIDRGDGYSIAHRGETLQVGDRVVTMDASGAVLKHSDGCIAQLAENSMVKMEQVSVCKSNNGLLQKSGPFVAAAIGVRPSRKNTATDAAKEPILEGAEATAYEEPVVSEAAAAASESVGVVSSGSAGVLAGVSTGTMIAIGAGAAAILAAVAGGSSASDH